MNRRDGQTTQTRRTEQTDCMDGQMHQPNGLEETDTRTNGSEVWIDETDQTDGRTDGLTN